jgi:hypothetical protein
MTPTCMRCSSRKTASASPLPVRGGLIKVFDAVSCKPLWEQRNIGYRQEELDERLIQTRATGSGLERPLFSLARSQ